MNKFSKVISLFLTAFRFILIKKNVVGQLLSKLFALVNAESIETVCVANIVGVHTMYIYDVDLNKHILHLAVFKETYGHRADRPI